MYRDVNGSFNSWLVVRQGSPFSVTDEITHTGEGGGPKETDGNDGLIRPILSTVSDVSEQGSRKTYTPWARSLPSCGQLVVGWGTVDPVQPLNDRRPCLHGSTSSLSCPRPTTPFLPTPNGPVSVWTSPWSVVALESEVCLGTGQGKLAVRGVEM